jgi:hypothetical protein
MQIGTDDFDQLVFVDGATTQFKINGHMGRDGRGSAEHLDILGSRVDNREELLHVLKVTQCLNATRCGAGADGHQVF